MKKQLSTFEYRLDEPTTFQDDRGREIMLPPNTRMVYAGYNDEGMGIFVVSAGKENGRKLQTSALPATTFRGGLAEECRSCGATLDTNARSSMVPDLCSACEDTGTF